MSVNNDIERILLDHDPQLLSDAEALLNRIAERGVRRSQMMGLVRAAIFAHEQQKPGEVLQYAANQRRKLEQERDKNASMIAFWSEVRSLVQTIQTSAKALMVGHETPHVSQLQAAMTLATTRHLAAHSSYLGDGRR